MRNDFTAIIEAASDGGYFAYCPEIARANGQGEAIEEYRQSFIEAITLTVLDYVGVIYQILFKSKTNPGSTFSPESCFGSFSTSTD